MQHTALRRSKMNADSSKIAVSHYHAIANFDFVLTLTVRQEVLAFVKGRCSQSVIFCAPKGRRETCKMVSRSIPNCREAGHHSAKTKIILLIIFLILTTLMFYPGVKSCKEE